VAPLGVKAVLNSKKHTGWSDVAGLPLACFTITIPTIGAEFAVVKLFQIGFENVHLTVEAVGLSSILPVKACIA
jgi:hypothetical protein